MLLRNAFLFLFTIPFAAFGQVQIPVPHSISGYVVDAGGEPLSGVEVTLEKSSMEFRMSFSTDREGMYHFDCLSEGLYSLTFKLQGFITERMENFTYRTPSSLKLNRELQFDPAAEHAFIFPADSPARGLVVIVRDNQSSDYLKNAQVVVRDSNSIRTRATTNACGNTTVFLDPGKSYSVSILKDGFQEKSIHLDMPNDAKELEIRLNPIKK